MGLFDRIKRAFTGEDPAIQSQEKEPSRIQFDAYDEGMEKTRKSFSQKINELMADFRTVDESFFEDLEETFISADMGFEMTIAITDALRDEVKMKNAKNSQEVREVIVEKLVDIYEKGEHQSPTIKENPNGPTVLLFVGVNGVGKTTSIGKLAHNLKTEGHHVILAAADTFRAGAIEQLREWGNRTQTEVIFGEAGGDPASVVFDAIEHAQKNQADYVLVDTAGRLQNKVNLMNELEKINRIIERKLGHPAEEVLLVLDATTGQNALIQAKQFQSAVPLTGLILTKLDGTAKGGVILSIRHEMNIPVKYVGLGEQMGDLRAFDPELYMMGLIRDLVE
ncbi:signal recognition particle-docking protein FtsY [Atopobacter phocae]|uniref:signal recognition particle-docking protein FtsY n=1 Tax=Atopobacter phocae TaxID=136492 RepID=UPI00046EA700|nr:signal recognition particle-docking protein FtsY [Atopobacter phocae]